MRPAPDFQPTRAQQPIRVLLLEDDTGFADLARTLLKRVTWGTFELEWVDTMERALQALEARDVDLIITDLNLPDSKGLDTVARLAAASDRLIVVITSDHGDALHDDAVARGAYDLIGKKALDRVSLERLLRLAAMQANTYRSLRQSEARFKAIVNAEPQCVKLLDEDCNLVDMNPAGLRMVEADGLDQLRGRCVLNLVAAEHREAFRVLTERVARGEEGTLEFEVVGLKGTRRWLETNAVPFQEEEGGRRLVLGITRDVTERRRAELALRESEGRNRGAAELLSDWLWEQDTELRFTRFGEGALRIFPELARNVGLRRWELEGIEPVNFTWEEHRACLERRESFRELIYLRRDAAGVSKYASISGWPRFDERGAFQGYRGIAADITARMRVQQELAESEARFRSLVELSSDWYWEQDEKLRFTRLSGGTYDIDGKAIGKCRWEIEGLQPVGGAWEAHRADLEARRPFRNFEYKRTGGDGEVRYVTSSGEPVFDAAGRFRGYRGVASDITERKRAEEALRRAEQELRLIFDNAVEGIFRVDADGRVRVVNASLALMLGYGSVREMIRAINDVARQVYVDPADRDRYLGAIREHGMVTAFETRFRRKDGEAIWVSVSGRKMRDPATGATYHLGTVKDITERKREEGLIKLEHAVAGHLAEAESVEEALRAVSEEICRSNDWECGRFFLPDASGEVMAFTAGWSTDNPSMREFMANSVGLRMRRGEGLIGHAWQGAAPLWVPDVSREPRVKFTRLANAAGLHGTAVFPLLWKGRVNGAMSFSSRNVREPDERLLRTFGVIGSQVGQFLQRKRAEEEQRASRLLLDNIVENIPASVQLKSVGDGLRMVMWNKAAEKMYGLPREKALGRTVHDLWPRERADAMEAADRRLLERGGMDEFPDRIAMTMDRGDIRVHMRKVPLLDPSGRPSHLLIIADEVTERLAAERLMRLEHTVTRVLADNDDPDRAAREVIRAICESEGWQGGRYFALDEAGGEMQLHEAWSDGSGAMDRFLMRSGKKAYRRGEGLVGHAWESGEIQWSEDPAGDPRTAQRGLTRDTGLASAFAFPVYFEGRVCGVLSVASTARRAPDGRFLGALGVIGSQIGQYFTRKRAERALVEGEARFRETFELAASGIAHVSPDGRYLRANRKLCQVLGYTEEELQGLTTKAISHPEDVDLMDARLARLQRGEVQSVRGEKRYVRKDGTTVWVEIMVALTRDADGKPLHHISIYEDVSERKAAEGALRRFRSALDGSADMVLLAELRGRTLIDFNGTACSYLGYPREELLGMPSEAILEGVTGEQLMESYKPLIASPGRADSVVRTFRRKDGRTFEAEVLRRVIESPDGPILVINARDLTERNLAQEHLALHARYQESIARFGAGALDRRRPNELMDDAVQAAREALKACVVAYVERDAEAGVVRVRSLAGATGAATAAPGASAALELALDHGEVAVTETPPGFEWAAGMRSAALAPVHGDDAVRGALCAFAPQGLAFGAEETKFLVTVASVLSAGLRRIHSEDRLAFLAQFDALTGLPNRALLSDRFSQLIVQARRHSTLLGVLFIDLDDFKSVNDTLGHAAGDELLKEVAGRLQGSVRPGDTVARISGDEFAVVLGDLAKADDAALVAEKIIERLSQPLELRGQEAFVTASIGIAAFPADGGEAETLLGAADAAMYRAKEAGRNGYQFFTPEITHRTRVKAQLAVELRRALERGEFELAYQPKFDLRTGLPCAAEALLRWRHPERGLVSPGEFIPTLEETGLIVAVGEWVLRRACADLVEWQAAGIAPVPLAVNLSARQFRQQDLDQRIRAIVRQAGVNPDMIELEITESQVMHDPEHARRVMNSLAESGFRVALDDFGTGYSSLSYLTSFPVSALKIDRSFVADALNDPADAAIVRTIIDMAHTLGFLVVAEGVETEAQVIFLRSLGCEQAQGYHFARPMPEADLRPIIAALSKAPRRGLRRS